MIDLATRIQRILALSPDLPLTQGEPMILADRIAFEMQDLLTTQTAEFADYIDKAIDHLSTLLAFEERPTGLDNSVRIASLKEKPAIWNTVKRTYTITFGLRG